MNMMGRHLRGPKPDTAVTDPWKFTGPPGPGAGFSRSYHHLGRLDRGPGRAGRRHPDCFMEALMSSRRAPFSIALLASALAVGCGEQDPGNVTPPPFGLVVSEIVASNDGVYLDEESEADDFVELANLGGTPVVLSSYRLSDKPDDDGVRLPAITLGPGQAVVLWADEQLEQGDRHLPFSLRASGETLRLLSKGGAVIEAIKFAALEPNQSFARHADLLVNADARGFSVCRYPSPGRVNGACGPTPPPPLPADVTFAPFTWPAPWPPLAQPLAIVEVALRPAAFVEIENTGAAAIPMDEIMIRLATHGPGLPWPEPLAGMALAAAAGAPSTLAPGARAIFTVTAGDTAALESDPAFEGVLTLSRPAAGGDVGAPRVVVDRVDFMRWPDGAVLARDAATAWRFCRNATPGQPNTPCDVLPSRAVGDRLRHLYTPGDFAALAEGATAVDQRPVKFVVDRTAGGVVHLLSSRVWPLHYNFVRELIDKEVTLDLCDATQNGLFRDGWLRFSQTEYFVVEGRRYLLGTLVEHGGAHLKTMEFAMGDAISGAQMREAFFAVAANTDHPTEWVLRPQAADQVAQVRAVEGLVPAVGPEAPRRGVTFQPLTLAEGFGLLRFVPADQLQQTIVDPRTILITDDVPNDLPLVGGLITEAFQTPLSHVNVLSKGRGTPNMALTAARTDPTLAPLLGQPVRLEVRADGFSVRAATPLEVETFFRERFGETKVLTPRLDLTTRDLLPLASLSLADLPRVGAKAAQLAELAHVQSPNGSCPGGMNTPRDAFAIPVVHGTEHARASGAQALIDKLLADPTVRADAEKRDLALRDIRTAILARPVEPGLLAKVEQEVRARYGNAPIRLRSSANAEDLPGFGGAGLYTSARAALDDPDRTVAAGILTVWSSLWRARAFAERELFGIDHASVAMGVLVHGAYESEEANGVAMSRNLLDPVESDVYYVNVQKGEASVTNPAPGVGTEQFLYRWGRLPRVVWQSHSTFSPTTSVLSLPETDLLMCRMSVIHNHFRALLDPDHANPFFTMEIEWKIAEDLAGRRTVAIKQARPYNFGRAEIPLDCRERL